MPYATESRQNTDLATIVKTGVSPPLPTQPLKARFSRNAYFLNLQCLPWPGDQGENLNLTQDKNDGARQALRALEVPERMRARTNGDPMSSTHSHDAPHQEEPFKPAGLLEILIAQLNKGDMSAGGRKQTSEPTHPLSNADEDDSSEFEHP